jgi:hypothetical protein
MTKEELKIYFWNKFNSCYPVIHDDYFKNVFMFYDINYIRAKKLANIIDKDFSYPTEVKGKCLFQLDFNFNWFDIDNELWKDLYSKCPSEIDTLSEFRILINEWLSEYENLCNLTTFDVIDKIKNIHKLKPISSDIKEFDIPDIYTFKNKRFHLI